MPLLKIQTNTSPDTLDRGKLVQNASALVAGMLGKPEQYVMVSLEHNDAMLFGGSNEPLAYLELKSIGLPESKTADLSARLAALIHDELQVPASRIYIEFADAARHMWGWNGATF